MDLVGEKSMIEDWKDSVEKTLETSFDFLKTIANRTREFGVDVHFDYKEAPGLTSWFPVTIWRDSIQKAAGQSWINDSWYQSSEVTSDTGLRQLRCGAFVIGIAESEETIETYKNWHKNLRGVYAEAESASMIARKYEETEDSAREIKQLLLEFADTEEIPGSCELEQTSTR